MTATTFDLDKYLAECKARMAALTEALFTPAAHGGVNLGDRVDTPDGALFVSLRQYAKDTDVDAVVNRTAVPEMVVLTEDGGFADFGRWHEGDSDIDTWVRYERYTTEGRVGHGYVDATTRRLVQTG